MVIVTMNFYLYSATKCSFEILSVISPSMLCALSSSSSVVVVVCCCLMLLFLLLFHSSAFCFSQLEIFLIAETKKKSEGIPAEEKRNK